MPTLFMKSFFAVVALPVLSHAAISVGDMAPNFTLTDQNGTQHTLSDYKGKTVVLEWTNYQCPFVRKHYDSQNMQTLQDTYTDMDITWLSVISSAPNKQGYLNPESAAEDIQAQQVNATAVLMDPSGEVGQMYGAETTPHMYVINPEGRLAYMGAIDSIPSTKVSDIPQATNYVASAIQNLMAGEAVDPERTRSYGCAVKY